MSSPSGTRHRNRADAFGLAIGCAALALSAVVDATPPLGHASALIDDPKLLASPSDLLFETASAQLSPAARRALDELAGYLANHPHHAVLIEGHTDSVGDDLFNLNLSRHRAAAARAYLVERGIEPARVQTEGVGESDPIAGNATASGRLQNRNVALIVQVRTTG